MAGAALVILNAYAILDGFVSVLRLGLGPQAASPITNNQITSPLAPDVPAGR
jgi:hypothetical protein